MDLQSKQNRKVLRVVSANAANQTLNIYRVRIFEDGTVDLYRFPTTIP